MQELYYDRRTFSLLCFVLFNTSCIIALYIGYPYINVENSSSSIEMMVVLFLIFWCEHDAIRNRECIKKVVYLIFGKLLLSSVLMINLLSIGEAQAIIIYQIMNLTLWWYLLYASIQLIFTGYYEQIRGLNFSAFICLIFILAFFFWSIGFFQLYMIGYQLLATLPLIILAYVCIIKYKHLFEIENKYIYIVLIVLSIFRVLMSFLLLTYHIMEYSFIFKLVYSVLYIGIPTTIFCIFEIKIVSNSSEFFRAKKYKLFYWGGIIIMDFITQKIFDDVIMTVIVMLVAMNIVLIYEMVESLLHRSERFMRHKNAVIQYEYETLQNEKLSRFLHDDILQDIYALKLIAEKNEQYKGGFIHIIDGLNIKIRNKMQDYGSYIEKSLSYKENIEMLMEEVADRYSDKFFELYLTCDDNIILDEPYDSLFYNLIKELLSNVYKHSNGESCHIILSRKNKNYQLIVENNGTVISCAPNELLVKGFGLSTMKHRVIAMGGEFEINIDIHGGLSVTVEL